MTKSKDWTLGYCDGLAERPPSSVDTEYVLGHMAGKRAAMSRELSQPRWVFDRAKRA